MSNTNDNKTNLDLGTVFTAGLIEVQRIEKYIVDDKNNKFNSFQL